jgi:hypothetical protein
MADIIDACAFPGEWLASWQFLSILGLITSWFILSLVYMIGSLMDNVSLTARAKAEFWEIITTSLILGSVILLTSTACAFEPSSMGFDTNGNMFAVANSYLLWLRSFTLAVFKDLLTMSNTVAVLLSTIGGFTVFGIGVSGQPFAGLQAYMHIINLFMNGTMICLITTIAQITVLKFIQAGVFNILLPVGIVCRSFPFTRQFGGALIAISVGLYIFYPFMLVVDDAIMGTPSSNPNAHESIQFGFEGAILGSVMGLGPGLILGGVGHLEAVGQLMSNYFLTYPIEGLGKVGLAAFILPAINAVVFVAVVRDLSRILGQEVDATSISRMI